MRGYLCHGINGLPVETSPSHVYGKKATTTKKHNKIIYISIEILKMNRYTRAREAN